MGKRNREPWVASHVFLVWTKEGQAMAIPVMVVADSFAYTRVEWVTAQRGRTVVRGADGWKPGWSVLYPCTYALRPMELH